jgi:CheY-like chemotaxis protein
VLVVDPCPDSCQSLAQLLQLSGYEVFCLHDGRSVHAACRIWRPTALIMELCLPDRDGWEVVRQIRQDEDLRDILLIAWTTCGREHDQMHSQQAGIDYHHLTADDPQRLLQLLASTRTPR